MPHYHVLEDRPSSFFITHPLALQCLRWHLKKQTNTSRPTVGCLTITVVTKFGIADLQRRPQPPCQSLAAKNRFCLRVLPAPPSSSPPLSSPPTHGRRASERASEHPDLSARGVRPFQPAPKSHHSNHLPQPITAMLLRSPGKAARSSLVGGFPALGASSAVASPLRPPVAINRSLTIS